MSEMTVDIDDKDHAWECTEAQKTSVHFCQQNCVGVILYIDIQQKMFSRGSCCLHEKKQTIRNIIQKIE